MWPYAANFRAIKYIVPIMKCLTSGLIYDKIYKDASGRCSERQSGRHPLIRGRRSDRAANVSGNRDRCPCSRTVACQAQKR